jgi:hypothetical protein
LKILIFQGKHDIPGKAWDTRKNMGYHQVCRVILLAKLRFQDHYDVNDDDDDDDDEDTNKTMIFDSVDPIYI